jgi:hypothetical protein
MGRGISLRGSFGAPGTAKAAGLAASLFFFFFTCGALVFGRFVGGFWAAGLGRFTAGFGAAFGAAGFGAAFAAGFGVVFGAAGFGVGFGAGFGAAFGAGLGATCGRAFGFVAGGLAAGGRAAEGRSRRVPTKGEKFSGTPSSEYLAFRLSPSVITGAPVSTSRVPGAGNCVATRLAANPLTPPRTRQANPESSRIPFANT